MKHYRAWALMDNETLMLVTFTPDCQDVELFPNEADAERVGKKLGAQPIEVQIEIVGKGMQ